MRKKRDHSKHIEYRYLPEFVYGSIDGIITTFAIIAGVIGASLSSTIILILGFANLFADGFSMAASNYLSQKSGNQLLPRHVKKPFNTALVTFFSFLLMGFIPLGSFVFSALIPNLFIAEHQFRISFLLTALALFSVGYVKGTITHRSTIWSSVETLSIGGIAALIAYYLGYIIQIIV